MATVPVDKAGDDTPTPTPTDDVRIEKLQPLVPPACVIEAHPLTPSDEDFITASRDQISRILSGEDDRLLVLLGPDCVHDKYGAMAYANMLLKAQEEYAKELFVVMQVDFETPRKSSSAAWKGLINEPDINGHTNFNKGLALARDLLLSITRLKIPISMEYLDPIMPQFVADVVSCALFGGRTSESQVHRELASGLSSPVGFANGSFGQIQQAVDACDAATRPHSFLSVTKQGLAAIVHTNGNPNYFVMLAGSKLGSNYSIADVQGAQAKLEKSKLRPTIGIDCAHNAGEDVLKQSSTITEVAAMVAEGTVNVSVVLMESYLESGVQTIQTGRKPTSSQSVTSPCLDWSTTEGKLQELAKAVQTRRERAVGAPAAKKQRV